MPEMGMVHSWEALVITVMAPTATSPPYRARLELKLMDSRLSVDIITKVEMPSASTGRMTCFSGRRYVLAQAQDRSFCR